MSLSTLFVATVIVLAGWLFLYALSVKVMMFYFRQKLMYTNALLNLDKLTMEKGE